MSSPSPNDSNSIPYEFHDNSEHYAALLAAHPNDRPHDVFWRESQRQNQAYSDSIAREQGAQRTGETGRDLSEVREAEPERQTSARGTSERAESEPSRENDIADGKRARLAELKAAHARFEAQEIERQASRPMERDGRG